MNKEQKMVYDFHVACGHHIENTPRVPDDEAIENLRFKLFIEEFKELSLAMDRGSILEVADALGDLMYVLYGTAISYGLDMEPLFAEIHRSNMTKVNAGKDENGKSLKDADYDRPCLLPSIQYQKTLKELREK